nr:Ycf54 [Erythrocladia irregularis]
MSNYYFAIASKQFLTQEEPFEEILRERINYYKTNNREIDFWFVEDSDFFNSLPMKKILDSTNKPMIAIVSTNRTFINWIKLRVGHVLIGQLEDQEFITNTILEDIVLKK